MIKWFFKIMCELHLHRTTTYLLNGALYHRCKDCNLIQELITDSKGKQVWRDRWVVVGGLDNLHNQMNKIDKIY